MWSSSHIYQSLQGNQQADFTSKKIFSTDTSKPGRGGVIPRLWPQKCVCSLGQGKTGTHWTHPSSHWGQQLCQPTLGWDFEFSIPGDVPKDVWGVVIHVVLPELWEFSPVGSPSCGCPTAAGKHGAVDKLCDYPNQNVSENSQELPLLPHLGFLGSREREGRSSAAQSTSGEWKGIPRGNFKWRSQLYHSAFVSTSRGVSSQLHSHPTPPQSRQVLCFRFLGTKGAPGRDLSCSGLQDWVMVELLCLGGTAELLWSLRFNQTQSLRERISTPST